MTDTFTPPSAAQHTGLRIWQDGLTVHDSSYQMTEAALTLRSGSSIGSADADRQESP